MSEAITLDHDLAATNIETYAREGRLVQGSWHSGRGGDGGDVGRDFACLLGSMDPAIDGVSKCPADFMPRWLGHLTVRLFDGLPKDRLAEFAIAYAKRVRRWRVIDKAGWERVRTSFISQLLDGAMADWSARIGENGSPLWAEIQEMHTKLRILLLSGTTKRTDYRAHWDAAYELRQRAWEAYHAAVRRRREAAVVAMAKVVVMAAAEVAAAAAEMAAAEVAAAVSAAVVMAAAAEAATEAEVAAAAEVAARRTNYARLFEILLTAIDVEIGEC